MLPLIARNASEISLENSQLIEFYLKSVFYSNISEICSLVKQIENKYFGNYANKQLISKEVESEKMRRSESLLKGKNTNNNADVDVSFKFCVTFWFTFLI